jgi:predicted permease
MALGIGPTTVLFSLVNAVLLRPLDVDEPQRLIEFHARAGTSETPTLSYPDYVAVRSGVGSLASVAVTSNVYLSAQLPGRAEIIKGSVVSSNFFDVLGRTARHGEVFHSDDRDPTGVPAVIVLSHGFWHDEYQSDPSVVGSMLRINGHDFKILGVMPESFTGIRVGFQPALWVPIEMASRVYPASANPLTKRDYSVFWTFGRLVPTATLEQVSDTLHQIPTELATGRPRRFTASGLITLPPDQRGVVYPATGLLAGVVGLVLLIACSSVSALLLVRSLSRRREIAVRVAIGATRGRLVRQLLTESVVLALLGGGAALLLTIWSMNLVIAVLPSARPMYYSFDLSPDWRVFAFALSASLLTGLIFGLAPAWQASRLDPIAALKDRAAAGFEARSSRLRNALVGFQLALTALLLIIAGIFLKDLRKAHGADLGFDADKLLLFDTNLSLYGYSPADALQLAARLKDRLSRIPGVESVALARHAPLSPRSEDATLVSAVGAESGTALRATFNVVDAHYFQTAGIALLKGRAFDERDTPERPAVAIVNQTLAEKLWPGQDPIGRQFSEWRDEPTVVGVVRDSNYRLPGERPAPHLYLPFRRAYAEVAHTRGMVVLVRAADRPESLVEAVRGEVSALDAALAPSGLKPMGEDLKLALWPLQTASVLFGAFGVLALLLAVAGVYGLVSYSVHLRRPEIGIRMALGAQPRDLILLFVRQGLILALAGVVVGVLAALGLTRLLRPFLSGVSSADVETFLTVPALLTAVALLAIWWPARRAARVDPMVALRCE